METFVALIFISVGLVFLWFLHRQERKRQQLYDMLRVYEVYLRWLSLSDRVEDIRFPDTMSQFIAEMDYSFKRYWDEKKGRRK